MFTASAQEQGPGRRPSELLLCERQPLEGEMMVHDNKFAAQERGSGRPIYDWKLYV